MNKITISKFVADSRLVHKLPSKSYKVQDEQFADLIIVKRVQPPTNLIFLPMQYHCRYPVYIRDKLQSCLLQAKSQTDKLLVLVLAEKEQEISRSHQIQLQCLKMDVNMMLCFDVNEIKAIVDDLVVVDRLK